jgi:hypothetical protein
MTDGIRRIAGVLLLLCSLLPLTGCSKQYTDQLRETLLYKVVSRDKVDLAKRYVSALQDGKPEIIEKDLDPKWVDAGTGDALSKLSSLFPKEKPRSVEFVNATVFKSGDQTLYGIDLEYEYSKTWIATEVVLETRNGSSRVLLYGIHANPLSQSLEETNAFRLNGKPLVNYIVLALAIFIPLFTLGTAVVAGFSYIPRWKWLWIIFILVGFGQFNLNWTSGQMGIMPLAFELLGAMYKESGFAGPVIISIGVPLGAILFWLRRSRWRAEKLKDTAADMRN